MGSHTPKQFLTLGGLPVLVHTLRVLEAVDSVGDIILVIPEADREFCLREIVTRYRLSKVHKIVAGGERRQDSVRHGLAAIEGNPELVLVHDAVRPFLTREMIQGTLEQAAKHGAAVVGIPMRDTVKQVGTDRLIESTVDRRSLWLAQTPQAFRLELLREAHRKAEQENIEATDDAQLVEHLGHRVALVDGSVENIKITRPEDLAIGEAILAARNRR